MNWLASTTNKMAAQWFPKCIHSFFDSLVRVIQGAISRKLLVSRPSWQFRILVSQTWRIWAKCEVVVSWGVGIKPLSSNFCSTEDLEILLDTRGNMFCPRLRPLLEQILECLWTSLKKLIQHQEIALTASKSC